MKFERIFRAQHTRHGTYLQILDLLCRNQRNASYSVRQKIDWFSQIVQLGECARRCSCCCCCWFRWFHCTCVRLKFAQTNGQMCFVWYILFSFFLVFSILFCLHCRCALYAFVLPHDFACNTKCAVRVLRGTLAETSTSIMHTVEVFRDSRSKNGAKSMFFFRLDIFTEKQ